MGSIERPFSPYGRRGLRSPFRVMKVRLFRFLVTLCSQQLWRPPLDSSR